MNERSAGDPLPIACFVTPHGFGHAARACAVLEALHRMTPVVVEFFTTVPLWFFGDSVTFPWRRHRVACDVGLVQADSLTADLDATVAALDDLLPFSDDQVTGLAAEVGSCRFVLCDVAPLGIAVAERAGLPSVLVENFTWDWIYRNHPEADRLEAAASFLAPWFERADLRIQTRPACRLVPESTVTAPVSRSLHSDRWTVRNRLGLAAEERMVLLTMGGIPWRYGDLDHLRLGDDRVAVVPGASPRWERRGNTLLLPHRSGIYHPDLLAASDAVVGKLGYSTVAEVWRTGVPFGFISRPGFPESPVLERFARDELRGIEVEPGSFENGSWIAVVDDLLGLSRLTTPRRGGADEAATAIVAWIGAASPS